jgi:membrane protease YdiL (CAAX protease family)
MMKVIDTAPEYRFRTMSPDAPRAVTVATVLLSLAAVGALLVIEAFARLQTPLGYGGDVVVTYLVGGTFGTLFLGAVAVAYLRIRPVAVPIRRPTGREVGWAVVGVVVALVTAVVISVIGTALGATASTNFIDAAAAENPLLVYGAALVGVVVLVAPLEELLYRGVVQGRLRESLGPVGAIGVTAVLFALGHPVSYW